MNDTSKPNIWNYVWPVASLLIGYAISGFVNYMSYATKVDVQNTQLSELTRIVGEMNKKLDEQNEKYYNLVNRVAIVENKK